MVTVVCSAQKTSVLSPAYSNIFTSLPTSTKTRQGRNFLLSFKKDLVQTGHRQC